MKELTIATENKLERYVKSEINAQAQGYESGVEGFLYDLMQGGCQSGIIGGLCYYSDTVAFYKKYKAEIQMLLKEWMKDMGVNSCAELFGNQWDNDDPFAEDDHNQNLLAWFGFEETARNLALRAGLEI